MVRKLLVTGMAFCLVFISIPGAGETVETERLIIRDITGNISSERFEKLVNKVDTTLTKIFQFWSTLNLITRTRRQITLFSFLGKKGAKQHASYLEAGSFGEFLINTYGIEKMKQFNLLSRNKPRPWKEVFGIALEQLEGKWLEILRSRSREKEGKISTLVKLLKGNPNTACFSAQNLTKEK